jgi:hypothetical protein
MGSVMLRTTPTMKMQINDKKETSLEISAFDLVRGLAKNDRLITVPPSREVNHDRHAKSNSPIKRVRGEFCKCVTALPVA